jgi:hypothetical protein
MRMLLMDLHWSTMEEVQVVDAIVKDKNYTNEKSMNLHLWLF